MGTPFTLMSPRPFVQNATAVAVFFLPNTCTDCFSMFSIITLQRKRAREARGARVSKQLHCKRRQSKEQPQENNIPWLRQASARKQHSAARRGDAASQQGDPCHTYAPCRVAKRCGTGTPPNEMGTPNSATTPFWRRAAHSLPCPIHSILPATPQPISGNVEGFSPLRRLRVSERLCVVS